MVDLKVDLVCSQRHYAAHAFPIWDRLPERIKGDFHRIRATVNPPADPHRICMVAGWADVAPLRGRHRMIYVEHGAGQSYGGGDGRAAHWPGYSLSGGSRHSGVIGFISPNDEVAARWQTAPSVAVGCPKMDSYLGMTPPRQRSVCFAWHFDSQVAPEARSAWDHWKDSLPSIVTQLEADGWAVYGHAHPRWRGQLDDVMTLMGFEVLLNDHAVFREADVLVVDNSSLGPEMMLLDRPVVWLNAPWYRKDVEHGGRFWDWTKGIYTVDDADELLVKWPSIIGRPGWTTELQRRLVERIYKYTDGSSSQRAADWVTQLVDSL